MNRTITLYIAMSLDGYIATHDDNIDFLRTVEVPGEDYGYADFIRNVDTVIWGRKTFDTVLSFGGELPLKDKQVYVISRTRTGHHEHIAFRDNVVELISELRAQEGKGIYCDGGGQIVFELLKHRLIDTLVISIIPHLLGDGVRLFRDGRPEQHLQLKRSLTYPSGLTQLWYDVQR